MSDDIFGYFSNRGTRKVQPIDDDDFNSFDKPIEPLGDAKANAPSESVDSPIHSVEPISESQIESENAETTAEPKSVSHWDVLANWLGIKSDRPRNKPAAKEKSLPATPVKPEVSKSAPAESPGKRPAKSAPPSIFDLTPVPNPEDETPLSTLFCSAEPLDSETENKKSKSRFGEKQEKASDEEEFLEFEIEELTSGPELDKPRRSRRSRHDSLRTEAQSSTGRPVEDRNDRSRRDHRGPRQSDGPRERNTEGRPTGGERAERRPYGNDRDERPERSGQGDSRRHSHGDSVKAAASSESREPRRDDKRDSRQDRNRDRAATTKDEFRNEQRVVSQGSSSFGAKIFADEPRVDDSAVGEDRRPRRRRRRGGRDRERQVNPTDVVPNSLPPAGSSIEVDPPDDFFDEIGWQPPSKPSRTQSGRPVQKNADEEDEIPFEDEGLLEVDADSTGKGEPNDRKRRRRRRGRGREKSVSESGEASIPGRTGSSENPRRSSRPNFSDDDYNDEADGSEDYYSVTRRSTSGDSGKRSSEDSGSRSDSEGRKKFPTWEEAISVLVELNLKNHAKGGGGRHQRPPRGRGRNNR